MIKSMNENDCTVWTLYEIFIQQYDATIDTSTRDQINLNCREMIQEIFQNMLENNCSDNSSIRFLKNRNSIIDNEIETLALAKDFIKQPNQFWMAKNILLKCMKNRIVEIEVAKLWTIFIINILEKSKERKEKPFKSKEWDILSLSLIHIKVGVGHG